MYDLVKLKPLTNEQYDKCRGATLLRVQNRIGKRPEQKDFEREIGAIWTMLDTIALIVFAAALTVSSVHIIVHMGQLANTSYETLAQSTTGTFIGANLYTAIHQWGMIFMAEGSMILFSVLFGLTHKTWRRWIFAALTLVAAVFVIVANWQSSVGTLESIMPAVFTLGLGLNLERLIVATLKRRDDVTERFLAATTVWEAASQDSTKHSDYWPIFKQEISQKLVSLAANKAFLDAPAAFKHLAVWRELQRDSWAYENTSNVKLPSMSINGNSPDFLSSRPMTVQITNDGENHQG